MKHAPFVLLIAAITLALPTAQAAKPARQGKSSAPKKIYCWDDNGKRVCGDALPASAVNNARTEISGKTGLPTRTIERTLTPEERRAEELAAQQLAAQEAAALAAQQQQQQLVLSYADEDALNRAFDAKQAQVKASISEVEEAIANIRRVLVAKLSMAAERGLAKKATTAKSDQSIRELHEQIMDQEIIHSRHQQALQVLDRERARKLASFKGALEQSSQASPGPQTLTPDASVEK